jgi:hypothetical protein
MNAIKKYMDGGAGPKRKKKGAIPAASGIDFTSGFASEGPAPQTCRDSGTCTGAAAGGSGITVNRGSSGNSRSTQKAGTLSNKKQLGRGRVVTPKEMERNERRQERRSMTFGERVMKNAQEKKNKKAAEAAAKQQRYAGPRFL